MTVTSPSFDTAISRIFHPRINAQGVTAPLFNCRVVAGFPSPADDYIERSLDLNQLLIQKPAATFFVRAEGDSMIGTGIHNNDILVVDPSIEAVPNKVVICALDGELTVKRLVSKQGHLVLMAENPLYPDIPMHEDIYVHRYLATIVTDCFQSSIPLTLQE
ncbi:MAG: translesion error-prone DNA polymerase V autoproteolytic subunit [Sneathiella sp.]|nr:translesion error-prone DNA polymerase V autoproteolytic subunit [Sneathiella sp.]